MAMQRMIGHAPPIPEPTDTRDDAAAMTLPVPADVAPREIGGRDGLDPTRYGDWEKNGRCIDF